MLVRPRRRLQHLDLASGQATRGVPAPSGVHRIETSQIGVALSSWNTSGRRSNPCGRLGVSSSRRQCRSGPARGPPHTARPTLPAVHARPQRARAAEGEPSAMSTRPSARSAVAAARGRRGVAISASSLRPSRFGRRTTRAGFRRRRRAVRCVAPGRRLPRRAPADCGLAASPWPGSTTAAQARLRAATTAAGLAVRRPPHPESPRSREFGELVIRIARPSGWPAARAIRKRAVLPRKRLPAPRRRRSSTHAPCMDRGRTRSGCESHQRVRAAVHSFARQYRTVVQASRTPQYVSPTTSGETSPVVAATITHRVLPSSSTRPRRCGSGQSVPRDGEQRESANRLPMVCASANSLAEMGAPAPRSRIPSPTSR